MPPELLVFLLGVAALWLVVKLWRPLLKLGVAGALVLGALWVLLPEDGPRPGPQPPPPGNSTGGGEPLAVTNTSTGLLVVNRTQLPLYLRVSMVVPVAPGRVGVCSPFGPPGNRTVPMAAAPAPLDQTLLPLGRLSVSAASCYGYTGYSVWGYDHEGHEVFALHR